MPTTYDDVLNDYFDAMSADGEFTYEAAAIYAETAFDCLTGIRAAITELMVKHYGQHFSDTTIRGAVTDAVDLLADCFDGDQGALLQDMNRHVRDVAQAKAARSVEAA